MIDKSIKNKRYFEYFTQEIFISDAQKAGCLKEFRKLLRFIKKNDLIVAAQGKGQMTFGRLNILRKVIDIFSPQFKYHVEEFHELREDLRYLGVPSELSEALLNKLECYKFSKVLVRLYTKYESLILIDFEMQEAQRACNIVQGIELKTQVDLLAWKQAIEFLRFLASITTFLSNYSSTNIFNGSDHKVISIKDYQPINWCAYCFRRASKKGPQRYSQIESTKKKYDLTCRIHNSSNDKIYREAKNRAEFLSEEDRQFINQIHAERISCELHTSQQQIVYVTDEEWRNFGHSWIDALQTVFPNEDLTHISNWNQYVDKFHSLFENNEEATYNPQWIMDIFIEAEIWLNLEKNNPIIDRRRKIVN
ncbi:hypothetical protein ABTF02_13995 [Acinetobacter baumannii]